jgi:hypothetical protein
MKNVIEINSVIRSRTIRRHINNGDSGSISNRTIKLHNSLTTEFTNCEVTFNKLQNLSFFLFNFDIDPTGHCNPTGLYVKTGKRDAILIIDELILYHYLFLPDSIRGVTGKKYQFKGELIKAINSEMYFYS